MKRPSKRFSELSESLHHQLNSYALAAGAAGVGIAALVQPTEAKIVYTPANEVIHNGDGLDLTHDGNADFAFASYSSDHGGFNFDIKPQQPSNFIWGTGGYASALRPGVLVGANKRLQKNNSIMYALSVQGVSSYWGFWQQASKRYLGLSFQIKGETHYGWARLNTARGKVTLTGYAYETIPNKPILTGKTKGPDVGVSSKQLKGGSVHASSPQRTLGQLAEGAMGLRSQPTQWDNKYEHPARPEVAEKNLKPTKSAKPYIFPAFLGMLRIIAMAAFFLMAVSWQAAVAQTFTVIYTFQQPPDGGEPGPLTVDRGGNLYGTTSGGGSHYSYGTIFKLDPGGAETILYNFTGHLDGSTPQGSIFRDSAGVMYVTASSASALRVGAVLKIDSAGKATVLKIFGRKGQPAGPVAGFVADQQGNLYSTASGGSIIVLRNKGSVFEVRKDGSVKVIHNFSGAPDGDMPLAPLIRDAAGNLYGTTCGGGSKNAGLVFKLDARFRETSLYNFMGGADGAGPEAPVIMDKEGNLYGTANTSGDPTCQCGTVFRLGKAGKLTVLHTFTGSPDGARPQGSLVLDADGNLYGTTNEGGIKSACFGTGCGVVFEVDSKGKETVLYRFTDSADGAFPVGGLISDANRNLYGTATWGGLSDSCCGVVFKVVP